MATIEPSERANLREFLSSHFDLNELRNLAFDLGVDYQLFSDTKSELPRELIAYFERRNELGQLVKEVLRHRPDDDLTMLLGKLPPCVPRIKLQVIASQELAEDMSGLLGDLANRLGISTDDITLVAIAEGSVRLLISVPAIAAHLRVRPEIDGATSAPTSISIFDSLDSVKQQAWRVIALEHPPIREADALHPTSSWVTSLEAIQVTPIVFLEQGVAGWNKWREKNPDATIDFRDAYLRGADLSGADLSRADLGGADLGGADLSAARLAGANLGRADLSGANLSRANLRAARLVGADLREANLSGVDLREANLSGANLGEAILNGTNFSGADLRAAYLHGADLSGADLSRADLSAARLVGANLSRADLSEADLSGADLTLAALGDVFLSRAKLTRARMPDGTMHE